MNIRVVACLSLHRLGAHASFVHVMRAGSLQREDSGRGMSMFGAKLMAAASVEKQKDAMKTQMMEELQDKLKLEALESVC